MKDILLIGCPLITKLFNQDKDDSNTNDAVHTESDWLNANKQVENYKEISLDQIRDPLELETTRKKGIQTKETTSLTQDDKNIYE